MALVRVWRHMGLAARLAMVIGVAVLLVGGVGVLLARGASLMGATEGARGWLTAARYPAIEEFIAYNVAELEADARALSSHPGLVAAVQARDAQAVREVPWQHQGQHFWLYDRGGRLLGTNTASCDGVADGGDPPSEGDAWIVSCGTGLELILSTTIGDGRLVLGVPLDDAFVHAFRRVATSELVLFDGDRQVASSIRDIDGEHPRLTTVPPLDGPHGFRGTAMLGVPDYSGYGNSPEARQEDPNRGASELEVYYAVFDVPHAPERVRMMAVAPSWVMQIGAFYNTLVMALGLLLAGLLATVLGWHVASRSIRPLEQLVAATGSVAEGDLDVRVDGGSLVETASLAGSFNQMVLRLRDARSELEERARQLSERNDSLVRTRTELAETSRLAGMAEVASGVLHNVGNVLTSMTVSVQTALELLQGKEELRLARGVDLLRDAQDQAVPPGAQGGNEDRALDYVERLASVLSDRRERLKELLEALDQDVRHVRSVVTEQQSVARKKGVIEHCSPTDLVRRALGLSREAWDAEGIELVPQMGRVEPVLLDGQRVIQILVNLVRNAADAIRAIEPGTGRITVGCAATDDGSVQFQVTDDGIGIPAEQQADIFQAGFTTKATGHGYGLHNSALVARSMGGRLEVSSEGRGAGACFTLVVPPASTDPGVVEIDEGIVRPARRAAGS